MAVIIKKLSVEDWIKIPDNPRQRDTVRLKSGPRRTKRESFVTVNRSLKSKGKKTNAIN